MRLDQSSECMRGAALVRSRPGLQRAALQPKLHDVQQLGALQARRARAVPHAQFPTADEALGGSDAKLLYTLYTAVGATRRYPSYAARFRTHSSARRIRLGFVYYVPE